MKSVVMGKKILNVQFFHLLQGVQNPYDSVQENGIMFCKRLYVESQTYIRHTEMAYVT